MHTNYSLPLAAVRGRRLSCEEAKKKKKTKYETQFEQMCGFEVSQIVKLFGNYFYA